MIMKNLAAIFRSEIFIWIQANIWKGFAEAKANTEFRADEWF